MPTSRCAAHNGKLVKSLGDGLLAAFDSASTALRASQEMQASTHRRNHLHGGPAPLHIRVGVSAGDVIWTADDIGGRPTIEAERLQSAARPDQILCSRHVVELTGGRFDQQLRSLGARSLKGYPRDVDVFEVLWEPGDSRPSELSPALRQEPRTPFVARSAVMSSVLHLWQEAAQGKAGAVLVEGEAGVGKSRLVREVALRVHEEGGTVLFGRCTATGSSPTSRSSRRWTTSSAGFPDPALGSALELRPSPRCCRASQSACPGCRRASFRGTTWTSVGKPERASLREAVWAWLAEASSDEAVLFVVEDVHIARALVGLRTPGDAVDIRGGAPA